MKRKRSSKIISSKKGQVAPEYMVLFTILLIILIPLAIYTFNLINSDVRINLKAQQLVDRTAGMMTKLGRLPSGSADCFKADYPEGMVSFTIARDQVLILIEGKNKINSVSATSTANNHYFAVMDIKPGLHEVCIRTEYDDGTYRAPNIGTAFSGKLPTPASGDGCQILSKALTGSDDADCDSEEDLYGTYFNINAASSYQDPTIQVCGDGEVEGWEECETKFDCDDNPETQQYDMCLGCRCWTIDEWHRDPQPPPPPPPEVVDVCNLDGGETDWWDGSYSDQGAGTVVEASCCNPSGTDCEEGFMCAPGLGSGTCGEGCGICVPTPSCNELYVYKDMTNNNQCCSDSSPCTTPGYICSDLPCENDYSGLGDDLGCNLCIPGPILIEDGEIPGSTNLYNDDIPETAMLSGTISGRSIESLGGNDNSIRFRPLPGDNEGQINPPDSLPLNFMTYLQFDVRKLNNGATPFYISLNLNDNSVGVTTPQLTINNYAPGSTIPNEEYTTVKIPLADFNIASTEGVSLNAILLEGEPQQIFYLDNIQLMPE
jgi:hypothetical protein